MGRAKRPWQAKNIYREMVNSGIEPTWGTYAALIRAYGRARYGEDALAVYREMKEKGLEVSVVLYNTLLSTCADVGFTDEALEIFQDMKSSGTCSPDSWTFASLITIYSCSGKVEEAEATLAEMLEAGFEPNIFVLTSLVQCYGKAGRTDDVVRTFDRLLELGITPDDRFFKHQDIETEGQPKAWSSLTALHIWMNDLTKALENGEELPSLLGINTGHGKHKFSEKGLAGVFESHLKELNAPFHEAPDKAGWFLTTKVAATSWLESRRSNDVAAA
ncbi:UNVERIFIED_CONTAM: Pentatricopeptide repeat-containing protein, chloroplastic [Sesamum radiatum]|uniref:Pentatricopeptide repeat-containing protein, chloroplastic n=1 Tax=Sesamum radiatum TaxID=300843 RepID=A0AAW2LRP8_SESRA